MGLLIHRWRGPPSLTREGIQSATVPPLKQIKCCFANGRGNPSPTTTYYANPPNRNYPITQTTNPTTKNFSTTCWYKSTEPIAHFVEIWKINCVKNILPSKGREKYHGKICQKPIKSTFHSTHIFKISRQKSLHFRKCVFQISWKLIKYSKLSIIGAICPD